MPPARPTFTRVLIAVSILTSCVGCDQATKTIASQSLRNAPPRTYLAGIVRLEYALNPGGFLSAGSNLPQRLRTGLFIGFNCVMMLAICGFLFVRRNVSLTLFVAATYFLAGGIGNLIDRVTNQGLVIDFINVGVGPLRTGIFNVADVALVCGGAAAVFVAQRRPPGADPLPERE